MVKLNKFVLRIMIVMLVAVALLVPITSYATDLGAGTVIIAPGGSPNPSPVPSPSVNTTPTPSSATTPSPRVSPTPTNQTKLPQTGIEDYTGLIVAVAVLGVSAIFAYVKIKQYKNY